MYCKCLGFNFTFSDRFIKEERLELTQIVRPGAMEETDPVNRLQMFSVNMKWQHRIHFIKSVSFLKSIVESESKKAVFEIADVSLKDIQNVLSDSINKRLAH